MKTLKQLSPACYLILLCLSTSCFTLRHREADSIVEKFHERYNAGNFNQIYQDAGQGLKSSMSEQLFIQHMQELQNKMGKFEKENCSFNERTHIKGRDVYLHCKNVFKNGTVNESFTILFEGNNVLLNGYHNSF